MDTKKKIFLTNDDGITAPGLKALYEALSDVGDCTILAPDRQRSAQGHAITMHTPLRLEEHHNGDGRYGWALNGTTADCVKFALHQVLDEKPDLVVSGINQGPNTAVNAMYSGTVAGAAEAGLANIPSFAISLASYKYKDFTASAELAKYFAELLLKNGTPDYTFMNINIPPLDKDKMQGIKVTKMGLMKYVEEFQKRIDPFNNEYYWLAGNKVILDQSDDNDEIAVNKGYVTVTPLICDMTNYKVIDKLKNWNMKI